MFGATASLIVAVVSLIKFGSRDFLQELHQLVPCHVSVFSQLEAEPVPHGRLWPASGI